MHLDDHLLTLITFLPLGAGLLLLGLGAFVNVPAEFWRSIGLATNVLVFLLAVRVWVLFDPVDPGYQFVEHVPWLPDQGIHYFVGLDGISLLLVLLTTFLMPIVLLASWNDVRRSVPAFVFHNLFLQTGMLGAFVSLNLFQFYVFWELMLVPMYFIIGVFGGPRRVYAAVKFFLFTMAGSLLMLVAAPVLYALHLEQHGSPNLDLVAIPGLNDRVPGLLDVSIPLSGQAVWWQTQPFLFAAFALAFAIKVPVFPFHTWLPDAHVEAPTAGSVVLAGVLLKMGTYGFVRFALPLFPVAAVEFVPLVFGLALVGIVYGSLVAMVQSDVKRLVAYSSVAHLGFVMLGTFALNLEGLEGAILQMVNHGLATGALFILIGMLYERRHTREIAAFGGLARVMPVFAVAFGIVTMASIGLPLLNGFVGEFLILLGTFLADARAGAIATSGVVLAAAYMLWMYRRVFFGPLVGEENAKLLDLGLREKFIVVALLLPIFVIGIHPDPLLRRLDASVIELVRVMEDRGADVAAVNGGESAAEMAARRFGPGGGIARVEPPR